MTTAYISHPSCVKHDMGAGHPEAPERIAAVYNALADTGLLSKLSVFESRAATFEDLSRAHDPEYIQLIFDAAPAKGHVQLDADTSMNAHSLEAALHAAGAVVQAVDLVMTGDVNNAFCCVRPPGHHAEHDRAMGFCIFNNLAVGVRRAIEVYGLKRVAVVDFDVHHGNGTEDIFKDDARVFICQTYQAPFYPYTGCDTINGHIVNAHLSAGSDSDNFREVFSAQCLPQLLSFDPQIIFISAGFDAHTRDPLAQCKLVEEDYVWVTEQVVAVAETHCEGRIVSSLEGGYHLGALGSSAREHIQVLFDRG
ncbi:MAG: acetoin utilization deacetylase AcuC-like enzyme [Lentisphaeria bacterium]|jgi:acetoin utilization deacetylase AcuC-like enzyme